MRGTIPLKPGQARVVGRAFTLRFVPAREDLATPESWSSPKSTRAAIEAMPEGCVAVVDAMGVKDAGIFGDILCARMAKKNVAALVTDGVVRDLDGVLGTDLPVWCSGAAAPPSVAGLTFVDWDQPIGCGGVAVFPNDIVVVDNDGAVVIPAALIDESSNWRQNRSVLNRGLCRRSIRGLHCLASILPTLRTKPATKSGRNRPATKTATPEGALSRSTNRNSPALPSTPISNGAAGSRGPPPGLRIRTPPPEPDHLPPGKVSRES